MTIVMQCSMVPLYPTGRHSTASVTNSQNRIASEHSGWGGFSGRLTPNGTVSFVAVHCKSSATGLTNSVRGLARVTKWHIVDN
jgi:hypothetical protein